MDTKSIVTMEICIQERIQFWLRKRTEILIMITPGMPRGLMERIQNESNTMYNAEDYFFLRELTLNPNFFALSRQY
jgi:hypothetical protein